MPAENKIQTQSEAEEKMVDLPDTGSAVDVEIAETKKTVNPDDDTPAVETEVETASSEEMDDYGQKVQTRIDKLTKRLREAERREQAAVQYAQGVQKEAQQQAVENAVKLNDSKTGDPSMMDIVGQFSGYNSPSPMEV